MRAEISKYSLNSHHPSIQSAVTLAKQPIRPAQEISLQQLYWCEQVCKCKLIFCCWFKLPGGQDRHTQTSTILMPIQRPSGRTPDVTRNCTNHISFSHLIISHRSNLNSFSGAHFQWQAIDKSNKTVILNENIVTAHSKFLYQVFPLSSSMWHRLHTS